ncbi:MAG: trimethylamine methyltransferase [Lachnospiraceae bacterium]|jgi:trimethylamine--corrinoid protein Co-methyltransferase|nr:trimethylamine methyltransferase [Lachnospiraceae bacterium]MCI9388247.1 trimethylamine methyltransferase [Lachnospiraceae bacterium]MCI9469778.1 trimethylamine methyltransferase [Lachnospiraceae bacterium]
MNARFEVLTKKERQTILEQAFRLLETNGVSIFSEEAKKYYTDNGCTVDGDTVKIPTDLVKKCISSAPSMIEMYDREGNPSMHVGGRNTYVGPGPTCPNFFDVYTGERRPAKKNDAAITARLADGLEHMDFVMSLVMISDMQKDLADIHEVDAMIRNTTKPIITWAFNAKNLQGIVDLCATVAGSLEKLQEKPFLAVYCEPTTPFIHTKEALDKLILLAKNKIPCIYTPGMIMGATAPVTIAGAMSVGAADSLAGLVLSQLVQEGAPFIGGAPGGPMDMQTMQHSYGAPEWILLHAGSTEIFHELDIPVFSAAGCSDSKTVDAQSASEAMLQIYSALATGGNIIHDIGFMELGITGSALHMVMCNELVGEAKRFLKGIEVDEEHLAEEVIREVGPGGNYLAEEHTMEFFRDEVWFARLANRENYETWTENGSKDMTQRAQDQMLHLLKTHVPKPLSDEITAALDRMMEKW